MCVWIGEHFKETVLWSEMEKQNIQAKRFIIKMYIYICLDEGIAYQQVGGNKCLEICFNGLVHLRLRISS